VRLFRASEGVLAIGSGSGRGAWVCAPPGASGCLDRAVRRRALDRALGSTFSAHEVERIRAKLEDMSG
jgi:predicted RNA-binding protein YlxR (DUF448 family)